MCSFWDVLCKWIYFKIIIEFPYSATIKQISIVYSSLNFGKYWENGTTASAFYRLEVDRYDKIMAVAQCLPPSSWPRCHISITLTDGLWSIMYAILDKVIFKHNYIYKIRNLCHIKDHYNSANMNYNILRFPQLFRKFRFY